jgi:hypothetical protein
VELRVIYQSQLNDNEHTVLDEKNLEQSIQCVDYDRAHQDRDSVAFMKQLTYIGVILESLNK